MSSFNTLPLHIQTFSYIINFKIIFAVLLSLHIIFSFLCFLFLRFTDFNNFVFHFKVYFITQKIKKNKYEEENRKCCLRLEFCFLSFLNNYATGACCSSVSSRRLFMYEISHFAASVAAKQLHENHNQDSKFHLMKKQKVLDLNEWSQIQGM